MFEQTPIHSRRRKSPIVVVAALSVVLAGCATLSEPDAADIQSSALAKVNVPANWTTPASAGSIGDGWLATFQNPQLEAAVLEALANNADLAVAAARLERAGAQVDIAEAQLKPAVGLLARAGSKPVSDLIAMLSGVMLRVSWEMDLWGRMRYSRNAARAMHDASGADYRFAQQSIAAAVARTWFLVEEAALQEALAKQMADSAGQLVQLTEHRLRVGAGTENDVLLARTNLAAYQDAARQVSFSRLQALRALELLLGRYPAADAAVGSQLTALPGRVPAGIPLEAINRRPDMLAAERRVAAAFDRVGEAKAALLPALSLSGGYGHISVDALELRDDMEQDTGSVSATATVPLYSGGALTGQVALRTAEQRQAYAEYKRSALQALNEVEEALNADHSLSEREHVLSSAVADSRHLTEIEAHAYRIGRSDLRAVTQRQIALNAAEVALLRVQRERLSRRVDLHLALGGSFAVAVPAEGEADSERLAD